MTGGWFDDEVKLQGGFLGGIGQFLLNQGASLLMFSHVGVQQRLAYTLWYWDDESQVILLVQGINAVSRTHYDLVGALKRLFKTYTSTSPINSYRI